MWDLPSVAEAPIHRIHAYPAKFPAFLTSRALDYAKSEGVTIRRVADVFCGCGTVAHEATQAGLGFWGCDINPVATLIARVKGSAYQASRLQQYADEIRKAHPSASAAREMAPQAVDRLHYWFNDAQFEDVARLLNAIEAVVPARSKYREAFYCAFSAILKSASQWRQRSTKPAYDPAKVPQPVLRAFGRQCEFMVRAWKNQPRSEVPVPEIHLGSIATVKAPSVPVDMIVTSPPYVTSYEYADLHQLSALWLGYAADYRSLRNGSVGTAQHQLDFRREFGKLNNVGFQIVFSLFNQDPLAARAVANYYLDMQLVARRCHEFLSEKGIGVFVIGNTEYSGVHIDNASHLAEAMFNAGFSRVRVTKRRISNKMHTPFREDDGKFSQSSTSKTVYSEEFILIGHH
jgi:methylase of polypeptide subunit release factors